MDPDPALQPAFSLDLSGWLLAYPAYISGDTGDTFLLVPVPTKQRIIQTLACGVTYPDNVSVSSLDSSHHRGLVTAILMVQ